MREPAPMSTIPRAEAETQSAAAPLAGAWPEQPLLHLAALWIQVAGTLCNLEGAHCFVYSGPGVYRHALLRRAELARPRLRVLPLFRPGREAQRHGAYAAAERLAGLNGVFDPSRLQCGSCRAVTSRGVFVCPLRVDEPSARMGGRLDQA